MVQVINDSPSERSSFTQKMNSSNPPVAVQAKGDIAVYSCYFGKYEELNVDSMGHWDGVDRVIFTDDPDLVYPGAQVVVLDGAGIPAAYISRKPKMQPHLYFPKHKWVIYIDNRASLEVDPKEIIAKIKGLFPESAPSGRYLFSHPTKDCAYRELRGCRKRGHVSDEQFKTSVNAFKQSQLPRRSGLYANTIMVQKMGCAKTNEFNEAWYDLLLHYCKRDQVLLSFAKWITKYDPVVLPMSHMEFIRWPVYSYMQRKMFQKEHSGK